MHGVRRGRITVSTSLKAQAKARFIYGFTFRLHFRLVWLAALPGHLSTNEAGDGMDRLATTE